MKKITAIFLPTLLLLFCCHNQDDKKVTIRHNITQGKVIEYNYNIKYQWKTYTSDTVYKNVDGDISVRIQMEFQDKIDDTTVSVLEKCTRYKSTGYMNSEYYEDTIFITSEMSYYLNENGKTYNLKQLSEPGWGIEDYYNHLAEQAYPKYPDFPVSPGYTWTQTTKVVLPEETLEASITYNIKSYVREAGYDCVLIEFDGNLIFPYSEVPDDSTHTTGIDYNHISGVHYFAYKEGITILDRIKWSVKGDRHHFKEGKWSDYNISMSKNIEMLLTKNSDNN